jgi:endoglucanase
VQRRTLRLHLAGLTTLVMGAAALTLAPGLAASAATQAPADHTLAANTRFYVPPPAQGSVQQILQLVKSGS